MVKPILIGIWFLLFSVSIYAQKVERIELINATTDEAIKYLAQTGELIDLKINPRINFRAVTIPEPLGGNSKCVFKLTYPDGTVFNHSEGTNVYACFGDENGDYKDWADGFNSPPAIQNGDYTLDVTPGKGSSVSYNFSIVNATDHNGGSETIYDIVGNPLDIVAGEVQISGEQKKWHKITFSCGGPEASETGSVNPFKDYRFEITFTNGTKTLKVPGYFAADGNAGNTHASEGKVWRAHFCPPETGTWNYEISFVSGFNVAVENSAGTPFALLDGRTGSIEIAETDKTGRDFRARGRLMYDGSRYLMFQETGERFLKVGPDSPENFLAYDQFDNTPDNGSRRKKYAKHLVHWRNEDPVWLGNKGKSIIGALNYLASKGCNTFSFLTMNINGDDKNVYPYITSDKFKQFDCSKLDQWEVVFEHAQYLGMFLHFKTQETENERLLDDGNTTMDRVLYYRELVARFGHHLALNWNLGEENGANFNIGKRPLQDDEQRKAMAAWFKNNDPYKNHIVLHTAPNDYDRIYTPLLGNEFALTGASIQCHYDKVHDVTKTWINTTANAGKQWVIANDEQGSASWGVPNDGFVSGTDSKGNKVPNKHQIRHEVLWGNLMAGGAGVEYYFGYDWENSDLTCQNFTTRNDTWEYGKNAVDFFNQYIPFWEMTTSDNLTSAGYCFSKANSVYVVYLPSGGSTNVSLGTGTYNLKWYNPREGGDLQMGATGIAGGAIRTIGAPDNNDWVALITESAFTHDGNASAPFDVIEFPSATSGLIEMNSYNDFLTFTGIKGFAPAYKDDTRQCLAVDAANYKGKFAAAQSTFTGPSGIYDITISTLCELDGESSYMLKLNDILVGEFQNPKTTTDYSPATHTWKSVNVTKGAKIQLEFNSHTNGKIPEGNTTAFSRGRWTKLTFAAEGNVPTEDRLFIENDGYLVIEAESSASYDTKGFTLKTNAVCGSTPTGNGYLRYSATDHMSKPNASQILKYKIKINTPGTYRFVWRNARDPEAETFDAGNDSWLYIHGNGCRFFGIKNEDEYTLDHHTKIWVQKDPFVYECFGETHVNGTKINHMTMYVTFLSAGEYTIEYGGRTVGHCVDRIVLYLPDKEFVATDIMTPESKFELKNDKATGSKSNNE